MAAEGILVGVISDTHGLLRPEAVQALRGCRTIIHAGDVGDLAILDALREIAPVVAVRGNVDHGPEFDILPERELITIAGRQICVIHDVATLGVDPAAAGIQVVISGHSHVPRIERTQGVLFLNPGAAGPRRFKLPITLAHLTITSDRVEAQLVALARE